MNFFEINETIKAYCTTNGIKFVYGAKELADIHLQNIVISDNLGANEHVLFVGFNYIPEFQAGKVVNVQYSGFMMYGRKCETSTSAELDETHQQKYDRRLKSLTSGLSLIIGALICNYDLELKNQIEISEVINQFDENLDCVQTNIVLSH
jgi:hypothetical protein